MNNEVIKAMTKKEKKSIIPAWWKKNSYKVWRVVLFPLWIILVGAEKLEKWLNSRQVWSVARANEILNYYVPRYASWSEEDKCFYFFDNGYGWNMSHAKKHLKLKDRRWWNNHKGFVGGKIRTYLIDEFELEGFTKEVGNCYDGWTEITFRMNEKKA